MELSDTLFWQWLWKGNKQRSLSISVKYFETRTKQVSGASEMPDLYDSMYSIQTEDAN